MSQRITYTTCDKCGHTSINTGEFHCVDLQVAIKPRNGNNVKPITQLFDVCSACLLIVTDQIDQIKARNT